MAIETELKYAVPTAEVSRQILDAERLGRFELKRGESKRVVDVYMDTDANQVRANGFAFRIRTSSGQRVACLKGMGASSSAVHAREEIEVEIEADAERENWPEGELRDRLEQMVGGAKLHERATIAQTRHRRDVLVSGEVFAELTVDEVLMRAGNASHACTELEVELTDASRFHDLESFDRLVQESFGLAPVLESKFERAMGLAEAKRQAHSSD